MPSGRGETKRSQPSRESLFFYAIVVFIAFVFCIEVSLFNDVNIYKESNHILEIASDFVVSNKASASGLLAPNRASRNLKISLPAHLEQHVPILPLFDSIQTADEHIADLMDGRPSMVGIIALLQKFISDLHDSNIEAMKTELADGKTVLDNFFRLTEKHLKPFDNAYHGKHIFPVREDGSIFISLAAFREGYLVETLVSAFKNARNPEKIFVGAIVQNCFGKFREDGTLDSSGTPCLTGKQKVGEDSSGKDIRKALEVPPDKNGIEAFCALPDYEQYCKNGQIRVLYMHHIDGQGPSMARYYASKLWGGENYFMQIDSHLRFAKEWDAKYITDAKLSLSYPRTVLSSYPPGFEQIRFIPKHMNIDLSKVDNETVIESPGCRLCHCGTPKGVNPMIHIAQSRSYKGHEIRPAQTPFLGAGLVFAHGNFLRDVPFDPYLPWTFMGEEILLSMRAWTSGWNIYAPRKNLIIHQYRPAKLGLPKFYGSIQGLYKKFGNNWFQKYTIRRIKNLCGYPLHSSKHIEADGQGFLLVDLDNYGMGTERSLEMFMNFSQISINHTNGDLVCTDRLEWCVKGLLE